MVKAKWILMKKSDKTYLGYSNAEEKPHCGEPKKLEWKKWGKELVKDHDKDDKHFILNNNKLVEKK